MAEVRDARPDPSSSVSVKLVEAAAWGSSGGAAGVWVTWILPDQEGTLRHVPRSLRSGLWWVTSVGWVFFGAVLAAALWRSYGVSEIWLVGVGAAAPWLPQRLGRRILRLLGSVRLDGTDV